MITPEQRHKHSGLSGDGERVRYEDLVLPIPKWCRRVGNPFGSNDTTNDSRMLASSSGITITKSGLYDVDASADTSALGTDINWSVSVNGTPLRQCFVSSPFGFSRASIPVHAVFDLRVGDVVSITVTTGTIQNTSGTFVEVRERP